ncbi:MAG TPA: cytochrome c oxidase subunit II [Chloroflexia bacterium]
MPDPISPLARASTDLFNGTLFISFLILLGIGGFILYSIFRFRARPGDTTEPPAIYNNRRLELAWTAGPALILLGVLIFAIPAQLAQTVETSKPADGQEPPDIQIIGHQWWWEIRYPQAGASVITANEVHMPVGKRLLIQVDSGDVIHDVWIPQLGPKMDTVPGQTNWMWLEADRPGTYQGVCAEYCGTEHAWMLIRAIAQPQAEFDAWLQQQRAPAVAPTTAETQHGAQLFAQRTCINCHAISGTAAQARVGPDLSHYASRGVLGSGVLPRTPENTMRWLQNPQAVKPGNRMPNLHLAPDELRDLTAYMESLK